MLRALKRGTVDPALAGESSSSLSTMASQPAHSQPGIRKRASRNATLNAAGLPTPKGQSCITYRFMVNNTIV